MGRTRWLQALEQRGQRPQEVLTERLQRLGCFMLFPRNQPVRYPPSPSAAKAGVLDHSAFDVPKVGPVADRPPTGVPLRSRSCGKPPRPLNDQRCRAVLLQVHLLNPAERLQSADTLGPFGRIDIGAAPDSWLTRCQVRRPALNTQHVCLRLQALRQDRALGVDALHHAARESYGRRNPQRKQELPVANKGSRTMGIPHVFLFQRTCSAI